MNITVQVYPPFPISYLYLCHFLCFKLTKHVFRLWFNILCQNLLLNFIPISPSLLYILDKYIILKMWANQTTLFIYFYLIVFQIQFKWSSYIVIYPVSNNCLQKLKHVVNYLLRWHTNTVYGRVIFLISYDTVLLFLQRLERGENVDDEETFGQGDGDAQDKLSGQLGIELAVKVMCWVTRSR